jgi:hypothetical protein
VSQVLIANTVICGGSMKRRDFIKIISATTAWPLPVRAQQSSNVRLIGVLSPISKTAAARNLEALRGGG